MRKTLLALFFSVAACGGSEPQQHVECPFFCVESKTVTLHLVDKATNAAIVADPTKDFSDAEARSLAGRCELPNSMGLCSVVDFYTPLGPQTIHVAVPG
jgi:hypothetical protein